MPFVKSNQSYINISMVESIEPQFAGKGDDYDGPLVVGVNLRFTDKTSYFCEGEEAWKAVVSWMKNGAVGVLDLDPKPPRGPLTF